jgi:acyl-CoA synthetase (AMP-forming)/AMP-acid ligase II
VPDAEWGESVKAWVVLRPGQDTDARTLIEHCRSLIASYKKRRIVAFTPDLPRCSTARWTRRRCDEWSSARVMDSQPRVCDVDGPEDRRNPPHVPA